MPSALCNPDEELLVLSFVCLFAALLYSFFNAYYATVLAEKYLDPNHWAGLHSRYGPSRFFCKCVRANTGLGYTPEGRRIWWQGNRYFFFWVVFWWVAFSGALLVRHYCA